MTGHTPLGSGASSWWFDGHQPIPWANPVSATCRFISQESQAPKADDVSCKQLMRVLCYSTFFMFRLLNVSAV